MINYVFDGQHTIEAVALVSNSRETPVWCMIYDHLCYEHEAHIFAEKQKHHRSVAPYDTFNAHLESGSEKHLLIRDLVLSYNLELGSTQKRHGTICAIAALENIFDTYGYHVLDKALRMLVSTWEGEMYSLSGNTLNAMARLIAAYGDALNEETFKERLGLIPMKTIIRTARERRPGSLGYAEAMLVFYNKKCRYRLSCASSTVLPAMKMILTMMTIRIPMSKKWSVPTIWAQTTFQRKKSGTQGEITPRVPL